MPFFVAPVRLPLGKQPPPLKAAAGRPHLLTLLHPRSGSLYCRQFIFCEVLHKPIAILFFYAIIQYIQQRQHPALWRYHMIILGFIHFSSTSFLRLQSCSPFFIIVFFIQNNAYIHIHQNASCILFLSLLMRRPLPFHRKRLPFFLSVISDSIDFGGLRTPCLKRVPRTPLVQTPLSVAFVVESVLTGGFASVCSQPHHPFCRIASFFP